MPKVTPISNPSASLVPALGTRFGALEEMRYAESPGRLFIRQWFEPRFIESSDTRWAVGDALAQILATELDPLFLEVFGSFSAEAAPSECWIAWEKVNGPTLADIQRNAKIPETDRLDWLKPLLVACAEAVDAVAEEPGGMPVSLAADQVYLDFGAASFKAEFWRHTEIAKWPEFRIRLLPMSLDFLMPLVLFPVETHPRRLEWLQRPLPVRFAGMLLELFGGQAYPEGCPKAEKFAGARFLDRAGTNALSIALDDKKETPPYPTVKALLDAFCSDAESTGPSASRLRQMEREAKRRVNEKMSPLRTIVPGSKGAMTSTSSMTSATGTRLPSQIATAISTHEFPITVTAPAPKSRGAMVATLGGVGAVVIAGGAYFLMSGKKPEDAAKPAAAATVASRTEEKGTSQAMASVTPPSAGPTPPTAPSPVDARAQAKALATEGKKTEAAGLLLSLTDAAPPADREALLREALSYGSVAAARKLGDLLAPANPTEAVVVYMQGNDLLANGDVTSQPNAQAIADQCLQSATTLSYGPALLMMGAKQTGANDIPKALDSLLNALTAFSAGNAVTKADSAGEDRVLKALGLPALLSELEAQADKAAQAKDSAKAGQYYAIAVNAGSGTATSKLADLILPTTAGAAPVSVDALLLKNLKLSNGATPQQVVMSLLELGAQRASATAMKNLASRYKDMNSGITTGNRVNDGKKYVELLQQAADHGDKEPIFKLVSIFQNGLQFVDPATNAITEIVAHDENLYKAYVKKWAQGGSSIAVKMSNDLENGAPVPAPNPSNF